MTSGQATSDHETSEHAASTIEISPPAEEFVQAALRSPATAVAVALLLRLVFLYLAHDSCGNLFPVGQEAGNVAWSFALGHGFSSPLIGMQGPTAWVAPVYPLLLALGFKLLSMNPYHVVIFGQVLNSIFSALTCWPIYLLAKSSSAAESRWPPAGPGSCFRPPFSFLWNGFGTRASPRFFSPRSFAPRFIFL